MLISANCYNFRKPDGPEELDAIVTTWQKALSGWIYPQDIYIEAVSSWLKHAKAGDPPPYPGDILGHCKRVMSEIEADPVRGPKLEEYRRQYAIERGESLSGNL